MAPNKRKSGYNAVANSSPKTPQKQARLSSFFASPGSGRKEKQRAEQGSVNAHAFLIDGDDDLERFMERQKQEEADEELARHLSEQWNAYDTGTCDDTKGEVDAVDTNISSSKERAPSAEIDEQAPATSSRIQLGEEAHDGSEKTAQPLILARKAKEAIDFVALDAAVSAVEFNQDIFEFDPTNVKTEAWPRKIIRGEATDAPATPFALLTHAFVMLSATRSRLAIVTILTNLLRTLMHHDQDALLPAIYLVSNHIAPPYDGVELGLGGAVVNRAIRDVTGKTPAYLRTLWNRTGDPGDVAFEAKKDVKTLVGSPKPIEVTKLFVTLHTIAKISGTGSAAGKLSHVTRLLVASRGEETRYLVRILHSHLRINAVRTTIATALARAFALEGPGHDQSVIVSPADREGILANPTAAKKRNDPRRLVAMAKLQRGEKLVREVRARHPNFGSIVPALVEGGLEELAKRVPLRVGTPISPMLGSITRSLGDMFAKLGERAFVSEFKYDGQRVQIHAQHVPSDSTDASEKRSQLRGGKGKWVGDQGDVYVRLFSRHLEDMTDKYPDITDLIPLLMGLHDDFADRRGKVSSFIMDAEVVATALDGTLLPFQTLANRSRKDVELHNVKVAVGVFVFDLMQLNEQSLLKTSFRRRRELIQSHFPALKPTDVRIARFDHVKSLESHDAEEVSDFFNQARQIKCEGIMVKSLDHHWEAAPGQDLGIEEQNGASRRLELLDDEATGDLAQENLDEKSVKDDGIDSIDGVPGKGVNGRGKALLSTYEPDKRCESWLKVKKDYIEGIGDSLDLVPIAGWHGMGRKAAWWSPVLLAVYDAENDEYQAVCKCISGFTDAEYKSIKFERFAENSATCYDARSEECRHSYDTGGLLPDVWFEPCEVWEIRGADITLSPVYTAAKGLVSMERGLSLRFPRFLRRRTDKAPADASRPRQLANLYLEQNSTQQEQGATRDDDHVDDDAPQEDVEDAGDHDEEAHDNASDMHNGYDQDEE